MVRVVSADTVTVQHFEASEASGMAYDSTEFMGAIGGMQRGPQCYRNAVPAHFVIEPHFHLIDQFQIFMHGTLQHGKTTYRLDPALVHYTDGFTPYGPFKAGDEGFSWFNLRPRADFGARFMPQSREELARRAGRAMSIPTRFRIEDRVEGVTTAALIEPTEDGLAAYEIIAEPDAALLNETASGSGRYLLVLGGSLCLDDTALPPESVVFVSAGDRLALRRSGPTGLHLLELQLPMA
jgi:hypothetical protein